MPTKNPNAVQFPPADAEREASLNRLLDTMSEFMGVDLEVKRVTILQVTVPEDRPDVLAVLTKVGAAKNGKKVAHA